MRCIFKKLFIPFHASHLVIESIHRFFLLLFSLFLIQLLYLPLYRVYLGSREWLVLFANLYCTVRSIRSYRASTLARQ